MLLEQYLKESNILSEEIIKKPVEDVQYYKHFDISNICPDTLLKIKVSQFGNTYNVNLIRIKKLDDGMFKQNLAGFFTYNLRPTSNCQLSTLGSFDQLVNFCNYIGSNIQQKKQIFDFILNKFFQILVTTFGITPTKMLLIDILSSLPISGLLKENYVIKNHYTSTRGTNMTIYLLTRSDQGWQ
jgi:hypothetical protein